MSINITIFLKLLSKLYSFKTSPLFSDTFCIRGLRHFSSSASYKGFLVIVHPHDCESYITDDLPRGLTHTLFSENMMITCNPEVFDTLRAHAPIIYVQDISLEPGVFENYLYEIWEELQSWLHTLNNISLTSKNFQKLIDACDDMLAEPIALINHHFCYVAYSQKLSKQRGYVEKFVNDSNTVSMDITTQLIINPEYSKLIKKHGVFEFMDDYHFIACNIFSENISVGRLISICTENTDIDNYQKHLIALLAPYIEKMYMRNGTFFLEEPSLTRLHQLLQKSLQGAVKNANDWIALIPDLGWKPKDCYQVITIHPTFRYEKNLYPNYLCPQIEQRWPFSIAVVLNNTLVVLVNQTRSRPGYVQELAYFLRDNLMCAGVSRTFNELTKIHDAFRQSTQALTLGQNKNPHFWYHSFDDYAFDHILSHAHSDYEAHQICHPALLKLLEHDRNCGSQYYETLYAWFKSRFNSVAAARALFIHRTTFIKRMEHIRELTDINFDDWDTIVYLALSFRLFSYEDEIAKLPLSRF